MPNAALTLRWFEGIWSLHSSQTISELIAPESIDHWASGRPRGEDRRRPQEAGFDHHSVKPVNYGALMTLFAPQAS